LQEEVATGEDGSEEIISELLPYDIIGDVSVVCNVPQPHTVRVCELCSLLRIDKQSLTSILQIYFKDSRQILSNLLKVSMSCQSKRVKCFRSPGQNLAEKKKCSVGASNRVQGEAVGIRYHLPDIKARSRAGAWSEQCRVPWRFVPSERTDQCRSRSE
jgi:hypothetical protein